MSVGVRIDVSLDALRANFARLKACDPGARVIAAVKANAYGHGLERVAAALDDADCLAIARLEEAERLRAAGVARPLLLMAGVLDASELRRAAANECDLVVHTEEQVALLEKERAMPRRVWLKVDTGMHRLGVTDGAAPGLVERLRRVDSDCTLGLMTHFANADDINDSTSLGQAERFLKLTRRFDGDISAANSALLLGWSDQVPRGRGWGQTGDAWIRPGISLYGVSPLANRSAESLGLRPVMQLTSTLVAVKAVNEGDPVGYGGRWRAPRTTKIGIVSAGYGDGYSRFLPSGTPVLVEGRRVSLAGVVSMDLLAVDLGPRATEKPGAQVLLWGDGLPVEEVARSGNTIPYALVTGVIDRRAAPRR